MINQEFWKGKKVFLTGHTGFKGSWLSLWLVSMGVKMTGYGHEPPTTPSLFKLTKIERNINSVINDVRNKEQLQRAMKQADPDIVIHMAAQPLVRDSYTFPVETYETNVMGTVYLLEAIRQCSNVRAVINVTTDKCYENKEWVWGYRENEPLGGYDPYSGSKACSELVTSTYRQSFFHPKDYEQHGVAVGSVRAGNVIGGGDWAKDRLIPDCIKALFAGQKIILRNPQAIRPWQHVLEPLHGYLLLAEKLYVDGIKYAEAWNFGPKDDDAQPVEWIVNRICRQWGEGAAYQIDINSKHPHEATYLKLDCSKAKSQLNWCPRWTLEHALGKIIEWYKGYKLNGDMESISLKQIDEYIKS
jgi:CDP-glucose 4,6-dehydratase